MRLCVTERARRRGGKRRTMCEVADSCGRVLQGRLLSFISLRNGMW